MQKKGKNIMATSDLVTRRDSLDYATAALSPVRGTPLKFDDGQWWRGFEREDADTDQDFVVTDVAETWRLLKKGSPIEYVVREPGSPTRPPRPNTFVGEETWPTYNGEPTDPWSYCSVIHLLATSNGETYNIVASTAGAWSARHELLEQVRSMRRMQPSCLPIVKLTCTAFKTKYGTRQRPMLRIVGWQRPKQDEPRQALDVQPAPEISDAVNY
jgi:hypothetical protein